MPDPVLQVEDLCVSFTGGGVTADVVRDLSVRLDGGRTLAVVGESGSGKTITGRAIMRLLPRGASARGRIVVAGREMLSADERELRRARGSDVAMVFQDSMSALSPYLDIGAHIAQAVRLHDPSVTRRAARARAVEMLDRVGIPEPADAVRRFPHEFSGGMRQRAVIAMALVNRPALLIADEPTTALDVTVQAQILALLRELQQEYGMAMLLISHDFGVVGSVADDVLVLYAGRQAEYGSLRDIFDQPAHPYTVGLRAATPRLDARLDTGGERTRLRAIPGAPTSLRDAGPGCAFAPRCGLADQVGERCVVEAPLPTVRPTSEGGGLHLAACHLDRLPAPQEVAR
ncbi:ABC transporter ATP-binding protein [Streptosporangium sp. NBC_01755]|uniref:ABC transporter ATP-binding protein n=1 Tax=unclassified Streptosporangium TaxID=2632669 RepID=UPI002DD872F7|nr:MULTISPECIES: ABC transporter ATP-binding protein [unclassified Streptosporangium]WSA24340.1 ABC transporter ATP-binding protein [Streptosporangium sp. NBC_01810]WSC97586.1 ABC transporter ATP-binding protein [Streptosporangium sp. NBC_01755]